MKGPGWRIGVLLCLFNFCVGVAIAFDKYQNERYGAAIFFTITALVWPFVGWGMYVRRKA